VLGIVELGKVTSGGAFHDSQEHFPPPKCHPDTRKAVLERILQWIAPSEQDNSLSILWLHGPAGAGKSAIAQIVAERTEGRELIASFFSRGAAGRNAMERFWLTIVFQLATSSPELRDSIGIAVMDDLSIFYKSAEKQLSEGRT
jgi:hypothetical protein